MALISLLISPPEDKLQHLAAGFLAFAIPYLYSENRNLSLGFSVSAGILKEFVDKKTRRGDPEVLDALYTIAGGLVGYFIVR